MILSRHGPVDNATPGQKIEASLLGGAISGSTVVGLMRKVTDSSALPTRY